MNFSAVTLITLRSLEISSETDDYLIRLIKLH